MPVTLTTKRLSVGERLPIADDAGFWRVLSGKGEVYAVAQKGKELSFHQAYLIERQAGEGIFPAIDEFFEIQMQLYALEDMEIVFCPWEAQKTEDLRPLLENWFHSLIKIRWLHLLADKGDDLLSLWKKPDMFREAHTFDELIALFRKHEEIFSMLLGFRFGEQDHRLARERKIREKQKSVLLENGIRKLLNEKELSAYGSEEGMSENDDALTSDAVNAIKQVAVALNLPTETIAISKESARGMDEVALLHRLAQKGNIEIRLINLPKTWQSKDMGALLGFCAPTDKSAKEITALIPVDEGNYRLYSRSYPTGTLVDAKMAERLSENAFQCYAGLPAKPLKLMDLAKFMFRQCWAADYRAILLCSLLAGMIPLATPIITETVFQDIIPILDRQGLATVTQALMVTGFTLAALAFVRDLATLRIATRAEIAAEAALWGRLLSLPAQFFRRFTVGDLASRMEGISPIKNLASEGSVGPVMSFLFSFWSIILMCYYSLKLTAVALLIWLVYFLAVALIMQRSLFYRRNMIKAGNKSAGTVQQIFAGLAKFRIHGAEETAYGLWAKTFGEHWNQSLKLRKIQNCSAILANMQPFLLTMALYWVAVYGLGELAHDGKTVVGGIGYAQFIAFSAAYTSFNGVLGNVLGLLGQYLSLKPQMENLRPILEAVPESDTEKQDAPKLSGAIEVSHLSFAYPRISSSENAAEGSEEEILKDISISIGAGENVAIVGKSGSGKSTLVRLLLGLETPKRGSIYFDGLDLSELSLSSVRSQMGVVLQNGELMTGDIYTNIAGTKLLSQEAAWEAAEAAGIAEDIAAMPMGMQTIISEGSSNISGGQRQRLLIARALAGKPAILVFDEATSALDNRSQAIVKRSLEKLSVTRIMVAHRLSTIRQADRIIVMEAGRIAEIGTFTQLTQKGGVFAGLMKRQLAEK